MLFLLNSRFIYFNLFIRLFNSRRLSWLNNSNTPLLNFIYFNRFSWLNYRNISLLSLIDYLIFSRLNNSQTSLLNFMYFNRLLINWFSCNLAAPIFNFIDFLLRRLNNSWFLLYNLYIRLTYLNTLRWCSYILFYRAISSLFIYQHSRTWRFYYWYIIVLIAFTSFLWFLSYSWISHF